jgi:capsular polysaccharide biosynthesis protein
MAHTKEDAYLICDSVIRNAPVWIESIYELGVVKKADDAYMPTHPVAKNVGTKTVVGFFAGFVAGVLLILIINFFDDKIKRGSDVSERYGIPLLGEFNL